MPACQHRTGPPPPATPTTVATLGQAYLCILDHWANGNTLDDRALITGAVAGLTQELERRGLDQANAMPPALTGNHDGDWTAARDVLQRVVDSLPEDPQVRQAAVAAAMNGMVASLHDDHASWRRPLSGRRPGLGGR